MAETSVSQPYEPKNKTVQERVEESTQGKAKSVELDDTQRLEAALRWVCDQAEPAHVCPICGWQAVLEGKGSSARDPLFSHVAQKHQFRAVESFLSRTLDPPVDSSEYEGHPIYADGQFWVDDSYDEFNALAIPKKLKRKLKAEGYGHRWAAPRNVQRYLDMGYQLVRRSEVPNDEMELLNPSNSSEDGTVRTNELVLLKAPERLRERLKAAKERLANASLLTRQEDRDKKMGEIAQKAYDVALRRNLDKQQAQNIARAIERGAQQGFIHIRRGSNQ